MDIWIGICLWILALFRKLLEIRRFFVWRIYRSLAYIADHDILWAYKTSPGCVLSAISVSCRAGIGADVASNREQVFEEQLPLQAGIAENVGLTA